MVENDKRELLAVGRKDLGAIGIPGSTAEEGGIRPQDKQEIAYSEFVPWQRWNDISRNEQSAFESLSHFREMGQIRVQ